MKIFRRGSGNCGRERSSSVCVFNLTIRLPARFPAADATQFAVAQKAAASKSGNCNRAARRETRSSKTIKLRSRATRETRARARARARARRASVCLHEKRLRMNHANRKAEIPNEILNRALLLRARTRTRERERERELSVSGSFPGQRIKA
jgi:hypothetical protein